VLPDYQTPWLTNLLEEGTQKLIFFLWEENGAAALQKVKSNGKQGGKGLERQQRRKEREQEKAVIGRYDDAQRPSGAGFLSVSSTSLLYPTFIAAVPFHIPSSPFPPPPMA
jgi:uncharacterized protein (UPF0305 family)